MRVTKKVLAKLVNEYFERIDMPYQVDHSEINATRYTRDQYEAGATFHSIIAKHKTCENSSTIPVYTMQSMKSMTEDLEYFPGSKLRVKNYGRKRIFDLWIIVQ